MLGKVQPGQPFKPNARDINRWTEAADEAALQRYAEQQPAESQLPREHIVTLANWAATAAQPRSCLQFPPHYSMGYTETVPDLQRPVWKGSTPAAGSWQNIPFGILPNSVLAYDASDVQVSGVCSAQVYVHDASHGYATTATASATLVSSETGPVKILWKPTAVSKSVNSGWTLTGTNTATANIGGGAHALTSGKMKLTWYESGVLKTRTGVDAVISGNAVSFSGGSGDSLAASPTSPIMTTEVTGEQTCVVQLGMYAPQIGFHCGADSVLVVHNTTVDVVWDGNWNTTALNLSNPPLVHPNVGSWPAGVWPAGAGWIWQTSDNTWRCRQPGVYAIRLWLRMVTEGPSIYSTISGGALTALKFPHFETNVYQGAISSYNVIANDVAVLPSYRDNNSGSMFLETWRNFAYDDPVTVRVNYFNPATPDPSSAYLSCFAHFHLLDIRGRPAA